MENQISYFGFLLFIITIVLTIWKKLLRGKRKLPPGPRKLPFIGNLHLFINTLPHYILRDLARIYGPVMLVKFGEVPTIVLSSPETASDALKTHDLIFASRPRFHSLKLLTYNFLDLGTAPYGDYVRLVRRIFATEFMNSARVRSFRSIREEEVLNLIKRISTGVGSAINLRQLLSSTAINMISRIVIGGRSKYEEELKKVTVEITALYSGLSLVDLFPSNMLLHLIHEIRPKPKKLHQKLDEIIESIIMEHRANKATDLTKPEDLVSLLLGLQEQGDLQTPITTNHIKAIMMNVFLGGSEAIATVLEWAMSELVKNPRVMKKAQAEVRHVFGGKGCVDEAAGGLSELKYLNLVIKEAMRMHPPAPLLPPRETTGRCEINGFEIPAKSRVLINVWAIGRDPNHWAEADKFFPERFLDSAVDYRGSKFEFIPFGAGRRACAGISFGVASVELQLANLLYHFDWEVPNGQKPEDLDQTEVFGTVARRKHDLCLVPIPKTEA